MNRVNLKEKEQYFLRNIKVLIVMTIGFFFIIERVTGLTRNGIFVMLGGVSDIEAEMRRWVLAMRLTGVGFFIGGSILLGVFAGLWIDGKLGTRPAFMLGGLVLGVIVAVYGVYQMLRPLLDDNKNRKRD